MDEVKNSGDIILFIDEIHNLIAAANSENEGSNIFSLLEPHIKGNIQFIGATNIQNYRKHIEPNGSFARLFELIEITQATKEDTIEILKYRAKYFERDYHITITYPALIKVIDLSEKLIHERVLPDKALDILNRTASSKANTNKYLTSEDISIEISEVTHVPVATIDENESKKLLGIEAQLKKRVIGQDDAIKKVAASLKRARVGIRNEKKPIASFLFVGTTGVGKTETAKALAREYFGDEKVMIRLDMSEYQQADSINRLIGTPDGKSLGILTEAVRAKPFSLILLDEIEKAYSNILHAFLQVLDDGRLTDSTGRVIDFTNTIIIATSNVGTKEIQGISAGNGTFEEIQTKAMAAVREKFAPEFLNRFNGIIVYKPLELNSVNKIAELMLESVRKTANDKGIKVDFKPELISELVKRGFNIEWGARPLARVIEDSVESFLATKILSKEIKKGDTLSIGTEVFDELTS
jgi:ATP-dependent Clp protease ATP-binding subunit ClpC